MRGDTSVVMKTGDAIATIAQPVARTIDYFLGTDVAGCSGCKRMQNNLNAGMNFADAIFDRFWHSNNRKGDITMEFIVTKQISVEADTPEEAVAKNAEGRTISVTATLRPQPAVRPPMVGQTVVRP